MDQPFRGAKLLLVHGDTMLTYLRDDFAHLPFPAYWDLPGGGREGDESPLDCALRELAEEFGLILRAGDLKAYERQSHQRPAMVSWFFTGRLSASQIATIRFGKEGQEWRMMPVAEYLSHPRAIPHFQDWIRGLPD